MIYRLYMQCIKKIDIPKFYLAFLLLRLLRRLQCGHKPKPTLWCTSWTSETLCDFHFENNSEVLIVSYSFSESKFKTYLFVSPKNAAAMGGSPVLWKNLWTRLPWALRTPTLWTCLSSWSLTTLFYVVWTALREGRRADRALVHCIHSQYLLLTIFF